MGLMRRLIGKASRDNRHIRLIKAERDVKELAARLGPGVFLMLARNRQKFLPQSGFVGHPSDDKFLHPLPLL